MRELIEKSWKDRQDRIDSVSKEEKIKFVFENGWKTHVYQNCLLYGSDKKNILGVSLDIAYEIEYYDKIEKQRKEDIKEGKANINCNKCGKNCQKFDKSIYNEDIFVGYYGLIDAKVSGGFYSDHLSDCVDYKFSLCEKCLKELFDSFETKPDVYVYM